MSRRWGAMGGQVMRAVRMTVVLLVALGVFARPGVGWAACSSYVNDMTINEVYELANNAWVELRILDSAVDASVYNDWSIRVCAEGRGCHSYAVSSGVVMYPDTYPDWITIDVSKWYVDLRRNGGMDILLRDGDGNAIDYLSVNDYTRQEPDCSDFLYDTTIDTVSSDPKGIYRDPDGTGDWVELGLPGANGAPTEGYDNDDEVGRAELVAHYALDGDVTDSSDNGYDGSTQGTSDYEPAVVCDGVQLDGSGYLQVPDNDGFDLPESFTIMAWIHPDSLSIAGHSELYSILSKDTNYEFHVRNDGSLYWWWGDGSFETGAGTVPVDEWTHVAFVYSRQDGIMRILANGAQVASYAYAEVLPTNTEALLIGGDIATGGGGELSDRRFYGGIDEVRIYNGTLSDGHIIYLMSTYNPCNLPTPPGRMAFRRVWLRWGFGSRRGCPGQLRSERPGSGRQRSGRGGGPGRFAAGRGRRLCRRYRRAPAGRLDGYGLVSHAFYRR